MLPPGTHTIIVTYFGDGNFLASNASTAAITINPSVIVLDPIAAGALDVTGTATIKLAGGVFVNSSSPSALSAGGHAAIIASVIDVHGGVTTAGDPFFDPPPVAKAAVMPDPYAALAMPSDSGLIHYGSLSIGGNTQVTIRPGVYSQISVSGNARLTLSPGNYIIEGGGLSITGEASVMGAGVMIENAGSNFPSSGGTYGAINLASGGTFDLTSSATGPFAGILFVQPPANKQALTFSANAIASVAGTIYAPAATACSREQRLARCGRHRRYDLVRWRLRRDRCDRAGKGRGRDEQQNTSGWASRRLDPG